jgi:hypothetical protein
VSTATLSEKGSFAASANWRLEQEGVPNPLSQLATLEPAEAVDRAIALFEPSPRSSVHRDALVAWLTDVKTRPEDEWSIVPHLTALTLMLPELQLA